MTFAERFPDLAKDLVEGNVVHGLTRLEWIEKWHREEVEAARCASDPAVAFRLEQAMRHTRTAHVRAEVRCRETNWTDQAATAVYNELGHALLFLRELSEGGIDAKGSAGTDG